MEFQTKLSTRQGSEKDAENMKSLFTELHFDVVQKDNLTGQVYFSYLDNDLLNCCYVGNFSKGVIFPILKMVIEFLSAHLNGQE